MAFDKILPDVKFGHFVDAGYTIAYRRHDGSSRFSFAIAYKHPNDKYNHKIARQIAQGRLLKGSPFAAITSYDNFHAVYSKPGDFCHENIVKFLDSLRQNHDKLQPAARD